LIASARSVSAVCPQRRLKKAVKCTSDVPTADNMPVVSVKNAVSSLSKDVERERVKNAVKRRWRGGQECSRALSWRRDTCLSKDVDVGRGLKKQCKII